MCLPAGRGSGSHGGGLTTLLTAALHPHSITRRRLLPFEEQVKKIERLKELNCSPGKDNLKILDILEPSELSQDCEMHEVVPHTKSLLSSVFVHSSTRVENLGN